MGCIFSINISDAKGVSKKPVNEAKLIEGIGIQGDAHSGTPLREVSLLSIESIKKQKECIKVKKPDFSLSAGDFAENITTEGLDLSKLKIGLKLKIKKDIILEITKIGKECHRYCSIYYKIGNCIMPKEGIFAKVIKGGIIKKGDKIEVLND